MSIVSQVESSLYFSFHFPLNFDSAFSRRFGFDSPLRHVLASNAEGEKMNF